MAVRFLPGTPKERPGGPQGPPRAAKAIFAPPLGFDPLGDRRDAGVIWPWDFCYIFIQKCGFRVGSVAKTKIRQTLRFAPPQDSFAFSLHAKHAGTAKGSYCMCFAMQRKDLIRLARQARGGFRLAEPMTAAQLQLGKAMQMVRA